jgi:hypothetical protein
MIRSADILYLAEEPASWGVAAVAQLERAGLCVNNIRMRQNHGKVMDALRESVSDAVLFVSPFQFCDFMRACHDQLRALSKPLVCYVSEHTFGNSFAGYAAFHVEREWCDFYACAQLCDALEFQRQGKRAATIPAWVATDLFTPGPPLAERIQKFCFVGHTQDYTPGMYAERRRVLAAAEDSGMLDILHIPRSPATAHLVAQAYASYAGVFCPPSNGRAHSIRLYEAAAAGAHILEIGQPLEDGNVIFQDGRDCDRLRAGVTDEVLQAWLPSFKFNQQTADNAKELCRAYHTPQAIFRRIMAMADDITQPS